MGKRNNKASKAQASSDATPSVNKADGQPRTESRTSDPPSTKESKHKSEQRHGNLKHDSNKTWLRRQVDNGVGTVVAIQKFRNPVFDIFFKTVTRGGDEVIFLLGLPFIFWNIQHDLARRILTLWWCLFYWGNGFKDYLRLPRPRSPPVVRLEEHYENEYGFPSTHSASISGIGSYIVYCLLVSGVKGYTDVNPVYVLGVAFLYWFLVVLSRLYLGVHTPIDIYGGLLLGLSLSTPWMLYIGEHLDHFVLHCPGKFLYPGLLLVLVLALALYPNRHIDNTAFEDVTSVTGVIYGVLVGSHSFYRFIPYEARKHTLKAYGVPILKAILKRFALPVTYLPTATLLYRTLLGFAVIVIAKEATKMLLITIFAKTLMRVEFKGTSWQVLNIVMRFVSYCAVGWFAVAGCPWLFAAMGIGSYHVTLIK